MADEPTSLDEATQQVLALPTEGAATATESSVPEQPAGDTHTPEQWTALMAESKQNRERAQQYERLYGQNSELQQFHQAAQAYADGDISSVQSWLLENAAAVQGLSLEDFMAKFEEPADEEDRPLTKRELKEMLAADRQAAQQEATQYQVGEIQAHAEDLGYKVGSRLYNDLLWVAMNETGNDLDKAHDIVSNTPQQYITEYVKEQREKARTGLRGGSGQAPSGEREITQGAKNAGDVWKNADKAAEEFLSNRI